MSAFFESLEDRRLLSNTVVDQVLGISESPDLMVTTPFVVTPQPGAQDGFRFTSAEENLSSAPFLAGKTFTGSFTTKASAVGNSGVPAEGSLEFTISGQQGNELSGMMVFNGQQLSVTGHVNLHGNVALWAAATNFGTNLLIAGQLVSTSTGTTLTNGAYQYNTQISPNPESNIVMQGPYATGHFSASAPLLTADGMGKVK